MGCRAVPVAVAVDCNIALFVVAEYTDFALFVVARGHLRHNESGKTAESAVQSDEIVVQSDESVQFDSLTVQIAVL